VSPLSSAIIERTFTQKDFEVWTWRWLTNSMGFSGGPCAKSYDAVLDGMLDRALSQVRNVFTNAEFEFLPAYLLENAAKAGLSCEDINEVKFLGHLIAFIEHFHVVNIYDAKYAQALLRGYRNFIEEFTEYADLAQHYIACCENSRAVTPTYLPGIMNQAFLVFKEHAFNLEDTVSATVSFMCQMLTPVYRSLLNIRVSGQEIAKEANLKPIIELWLKDHRAVQFKLDEKAQLSYTKTPIPELDSVMTGMAEVMSALRY
jgi:hypothetical protein